MGLETIKEVVERRGFSLNNRVYLEHNYLAKETLLPIKKEIESLGF